MDHPHSIAMAPPPPVHKTNYYCEKCDRYFKDNGKLTRHIKSVHENITYKCNQCDKSFKRPENLKSHIRGIHERADDMTCTLCDKSFGLRKHLVAHVREVHENVRNYKCKICGMAVKQAVSLRKHMRLKHGTLKTCMDCDKTFTSVGDLRKHKEVVHCLLAEEPKRKENGEIKSMPEDDEDMGFDSNMPCEKCGKMFSDRLNLERHVKRIHGDAPKYEEIQCVICNIWLPSKERLKYHNVTTHERKNFMCTLCGKCFPFNESLKSHYKNFHQIEPEKSTVPRGIKREPEPRDDGLFECEICERAFEDKSKLKRHVTLSHRKTRASSKSYDCRVCGKSYANSSRLRFHIKSVHERDEAEIQREKERKRNNLKRKHHRKSHHRYHEEEEQSDEDWTPYVKKEIVDENDIEAVLDGEHQLLDGDEAYDLLTPKISYDNGEDDMMSQQLFICWTCGKAFPTVKCHARKVIAELENASQCIDCDRCFGPNGLLETHVERVLLQPLCIQCHKTFDSRKSLRRHEAIVHDSDENQKPIRCSSDTVVVWNKVLLAVQSSVDNDIDNESESNNHQLRDEEDVTNAVSQETPVHRSDDYPIKQEEEMS